MVSQHIPISGFFPQTQKKKDKIKEKNLPCFGTHLSCLTVMEVTSFSLQEK